MKAVVSGVAACTPVGLHAESTCAALRAGIGSLMELATFTVDGEQFEMAPMVGGRVPTEWLTGEPPEEHWPGYERFGLPTPPPRTSRVAPGVERVIELFHAALGEIIHCADLDRVPNDRYRVYLGLNEFEPAGFLLEEARGMLGGDADRFVAETSGRAAGLALLHRAMKDLDERQIDGALIGGVDSLIRKPVAARYDQAGRVRCKTAPEGFNPGEAAAFIYLESPNQATRRQRTIYANVLSTAVAEEPTAGTDDPNRGIGLSQALRQARRDAALDLMPLVVCDLNGERPRALEWAVAATRALGDLPGEEEVWHPADCCGDPGAAAGVLDLVWACMAFHRRYAPRRRAVVWGASDGGLRSAAVLEPNG